MVKTRGFTLIELLVAVGVMAIVGGLATIILFTTLRSASKSDVMVEVKQNGDYALSVMGRMIRNAKAVSVCTGASNSLTITNPDDKVTTFTTQTIDSLVKISSNSGNFLTSDKVTVVGNINFTCTKPTNTPPFITIRFSLSQSGTATRPEEKAQVDFQTTVSLRTY